MMRTRTLWPWLLLLLLPLSLPQMACSKKKSSPQRIEGVEPGDCEDGADNDGDGLFDCADDSCAGSPICEDQDMGGVTDDNNGPSNNSPSNNDPTPTCDNGTVDANGECVCDDGFTDGGDGTCVAEGTCAEGFIDGGDGTCVAEGTCAEGFIDGGDGTCVTEGTCSEGFADGGDGSCVAEGTCAEGFIDGGDGTCVAEGTCAEGFIDGGDGTCVTEGTCSEGFADGGDGSCVAEGTCAEGFIDGGDGTCVTEGTCSEGFHDDGTGDCVVEGTCAEGFADGGDGSCVAEGTCAEGFHDDGTGLACVAEGTCAEGFHDNGTGDCGPEGICEESFDLVDGDCVCVEPFDIDVDTGLCTELNTDPAFCNNHGEVTEFATCDCEEGYGGERCDSCSPGYELQDDACVALPPQVCEPFRVNDFTADNQHEPYAVSDPQGGFAVAWKSQENGATAIKGRFFTPTGVAEGFEIPLITSIYTRYQAATQYYMSAALGSNGDLVVGFHSAGDSYQGKSLTLRRSGELVNEVPSSIFSNGGDLFMFRTAGGSVSTLSIRYNGTYNAFEGGRRINNQSCDNSWKLGPHGAALGNGNNLLTYYTDDFCDSTRGIGVDIECNVGDAHFDRVIKIYPGSNTRVYPKVEAIDDDGGFVVMWALGGRLIGYLGACTTNINVNPAEVDFGPAPTTVDGFRMARHPEGFILARTLALDSEAGTDVFAQVFNTDGEPVSSNMRLNTTTESDQLRVTLDELGDGNFVASWVSKHSGDDDVYTQVFGASYCEGGVPCFETTCDPVNAYCDNVDGAAACTCVTGTLNPDTLLCE